jgi:hypothetical protein
MFLCFLHLLTIVWWHGDLAILEREQAVCWPFLAGCQTLRPWSELAVVAWCVGYGGAAVFSMVCLILNRLSFAWRGLIVSEILKLVVFLQDYRFMGNYHYMLFWLTFAYLFLNERKALLPYLILLFYLAAGALKLNTEWISGAALGSPPPWDGRLTVPLQAYCVFLETVVVLLLIAKSWPGFLFAWFQLVLLHLLSFPIVGFYYPCVAGAFLGFLVVHARDGFPFPGPRSKSALVYLGTFVVVQVPFHLAPVDGVLSGFGRTWALNMFDSYSECQTFGVIQSGPSEIREVSYVPQNLVPRIRCDPIVMANYLRDQCRAGETPSQASLVGFSRRSVDRKWTSIFASKIDCRDVNRFSLWPRKEIW